MLFENEQKKYDKLIKAIKKGESKEKLLALADDLVNAFMPFYDGMCFPTDEFENEKYLVTRNTFVSHFDVKVYYGYTLYEWKREYQDPPTKLKEIDPNFKLKKWCEIFHCTSEKKQKLDQTWIEETIKLLNRIHTKRRVNDESKEEDHGKP